MASQTQSHIKQLIARFSLPLPIISFAIVTKWWFALPVDGPDKLYWGFPFPFLGEGFHTSMSFQFFILEFITDFLLYFLGWALLLYSIFGIFQITKVSKWLLRTLWSLALVIVMGFSTLISASNPIFLIKRDYDWNILQTGHVFIWEETPRPDMNEFTEKEDLYIKDK